MIQARTARKGYETEEGPSGPAHVPLGKSEKDTQTSFRLPSALYQKLGHAAAQHGIGIGEEIRSRVERSFQDEKKADPDVRQLAEMIVAIAEEHEQIAGTWRKFAFSFETFKIAVNTLLTYYAPKSETGGMALPPGSIADALWGADASPELRRH